MPNTAKRFIESLDELKKTDWSDWYDILSHFDAFELALVDAFNDNIFIEYKYSIGNPLLRTYIDIYNNNTFQLEIKNNSPHIWPTLGRLYDNLLPILTTTDASDLWDIYIMKQFINDTLCIYISNVDDPVELEIPVTVFRCLVMNNTEIYIDQIFDFAEDACHIYRLSQELRFYTISIVGKLGKYLKPDILTEKRVDLLNRYCIEYILNNGYDNDHTNFLYTLHLTRFLLYAINQITDILHIRPYLKILGLLKHINQHDNNNDDIKYTILDAIALSPRLQFGDEPPLDLASLTLPSTSSQLDTIDSNKPNVSLNVPNNATERLFYYEITELWKSLERKAEIYIAEYYNKQ